MCPGGESEQEDAGVRIAEAGNRLAPVLLVAIGAPFDLRNLAAVLSQSRAKTAIHDFVLKDVKQWYSMASCSGRIELNFRRN